MATKVNYEFVRFVTWYENQPTLVSFNGKVYNIINMCKGLTGEILFVAMDSKNNYKILEYEKLKYKKNFHVIG